MMNKIKLSLVNKYNEFLEPIKNRQNKVKVKNTTYTVLVTVIRLILVFGLSFVILFPIFQQVSLAFRAPMDINNPTVIFIPENWSTFNLYIASTMLQYQKALMWSLRLSLIVMIAQILVTSIAGYSFAKLKFKGSGVLFFIVLATVLIPPQTLSISRYLFFGKFDVFGIWKAITGEHLNLLKSRNSLYLMSALGMGINSGLFIFIFRQFFRGIPNELDESAQVDGASVFRTFWSVMLPNARPAMLTVGLFAFVWQYNDIYYTNLLQVSDDIPLLSPNLNNAMAGLTQTLFQTGADQLVGGDVSNNPFYFALVSNVAALLVMIPLLVIFIILQRHFVEGIERTGIVG